MKYALTFLFGLLLSSLSAQVAHPDSFANLLQEARIELSEPLENQFKPKYFRENELCNYQYLLKKKRGDLEIRYSIKLWEKQQEHVRSKPHISTLNLITTLASNEDDSVITYHPIPKEELLEHYQADWGLIAFFRPKEIFSSRMHCKMITLFAEDKAIAHIFYLFDEITEELENQAFGLMFTEIDEE